MLFGRKPLRHKRFEHHPMYYDPSRDEDRAERLNFGRSRKPKTYVPKRKSPFKYFLLIVIVLAVMWSLKPFREQDDGEVKDITIGAQDAVTAPAEQGTSPAPDTLNSVTDSLHD